MQLRHKIPAIAVTGIMTLSSVLAPIAALADAKIEDSSLTVAGVRLIIKAGSVYSALSTTSDSMTVEIPDGEAFEVHTFDGDRYGLENDALVPSCDIQRDLSNRLFVTGPRTMIVRPNQTLCSTAGYGDDTTPLFAFTSPSTETVAKSGTESQFFWSVDGKASASLRLRLSVDGGASFPTVLAAELVNSGYYMWSVPDMPSASRARLKIEAMNGGNVVAFGVSPEFAIAGTSPEPTVTAPTGGLTVSPAGYDPEDETATASTIGVDKSLPSAPNAQICVPDIRFKIKGNSSVYYCAVDGKRYAFPNFKTYQTWYDNDFGGVTELDADVVARIPLGGNVTYRPGRRMVKITTSPEVFAVGANGELHYVSEKAAVRMYGADWNKKIDDVPDAFFVNYHVGTPILE